MEYVHLYAGILFFWPRLHLSSPKLRSQDLRQEGLRGPHLGPWNPWAGTAPSGPEDPRVLSRGAPAASISPSALYTPSFRAGIGMPCLLDCSVEVRWKRRVHGAGDGHLCLLLSAGCHVLNLCGSKQNKTTRMGLHPVSFPLVRLLAEQLLWPLLTRGYQTVHQALASTHPLGHF